MIIDTHVHLNSEDFSPDLEDVLKRAEENNVGGMIVPGWDIDSSQRASELSDLHSGIFFASGVHPEEVGGLKADSLGIIENISSHKKCVAIGEIGLDYHWDDSRKELQKELFNRQLRLALKLGKPAIVHSRDSISDCLEILESFRGTGLVVQMHCFSGTVQQAKELIELGHYISFTGTITFKKSHEERELASKLPPERLLLETDSPYMSPVPLRGRRNEPSRIVHILNVLAECLGISVSEAERITSKNAMRLFKIDIN